MARLAHVARNCATPLKNARSLWIAAALLLLPSISDGEAADARALVESVVNAQRTVGFTLRAKLTVSDSASGSTSVAQIRVKSRRDAAVTRLLYEVLWPAGDKGRAVSLERAATGRVTGFEFIPPDKVTPITSEMLGAAYLGSDLNIEDLVEDFWQWPSATLGAEDRVEREPCSIVNLRAPADVRSIYSLVRVWISPVKAAPLRIVKFSRTGAAKEFAVQKLMQHDRIWVPVVTAIRTVGSSRQTVFEISRGERDVEIPVGDFSIEQVRKAAAGK